MLFARKLKDQGWDRITNKNYLQLDIDCDNAIIWNVRWSELNFSTRAWFRKALTFHRLNDICCVVLASSIWPWLVRRFPMCNEHETSLFFSAVIESFTILKIFNIKNQKFILVKYSQANLLRENSATWRYVTTNGYDVKGTSIIYHKIKITLVSVSEIFSIDLLWWNKQFFLCETFPRTQQNINHTKLLIPPLRSTKQIQSQH